MTTIDLSKHQRDWGEFLSTGVSNYSRTIYLSHIDIFAKWANENAVFVVDTQSVSKWIIDMIKNEKSSRTVRAYLGSMKRFANWLYVQNITPVCIIDDRRLPKLPQSPKASRSVFTDEEYRRLQASNLEHGDIDWHHATTVGRNTGLRLGDVANLRFDHINWNDETVSLIPRKTQRFGKDVRIPMTRDLYEVLKARKESPDDRYPDKMDYVFPAMQVSYAMSKHSALSRAFFYRCERAGVPLKGFHTLRHTLVSKLANNDVNYGVIASITGQSIQQISGYHHVNLEAQRRAVSKL